MGGACSSAQLRNITLCSQLHEVHRSLLGLLPRLPAPAASTLKCALPQALIDPIAPRGSMLQYALSFWQSSMHGQPSVAG